MYRESVARRWLTSITGAHAVIRASRAAPRTQGGASARRHRAVPRRAWVVGATLVAVTAFATTLILPSAASAQTTIRPQIVPGHQGPAADVCIQIYPPPPGCPGSQPPPTAPPIQRPDVCIQIYPPPPGCEGSQPPAPPSQVWPAPLAPTRAPVAPSHPVGYPNISPAVHRPGDTVFVTFRDSRGSVLPNLSGYHCDHAWFEVLGPTGWTAMPAPAPACSAIVFAAPVAAAPMVVVPAGLQPGTYRLVLRATTPAGGQHLIVGDPFLLP